MSSEKEISIHDLFIVFISVVIGVFLAYTVIWPMLDPSIGHLPCKGGPTSMCLYSNSRETVVERR